MVVVQRYVHWVSRVFGNFFNSDNSIERRSLIPLGLPRRPKSRSVAHKHTNPHKFDNYDDVGRDSPHSDSLPTTSTSTHTTASTI